MRKIQIVLICLAFLFFVTSMVVAQKAKNAMTNADVVEMVKAGLSEQIIITSIRQSPIKNFDLSPAGLIALKKAGVSDLVISVLQEPTARTTSSSSVEDNKLPSDDKEPTVNAVLKQRITAQSGGAISLLSFRKTNGYEQGDTRLYVLEWQAEIVFEQAGYKAGDMFVGYWQDFSVLQQKPGTLDSLVVGNTIPFNKGDKIRLTGDSVLRKTENGWRIEQLSVKKYQVLLGLYIAPNGEFSYNPPDSWELRDLPGVKYKVAALISSTFASNIVVFEGSILGTLDDFVATKLREEATYYQKTGVVNHVVISQTEFQTNAGQRGIKVIIDNTANNDRLRSYVYFFDAKNGKGFQVVCTARQSDVAFEKVFDASMKTFKMFSSEIKTAPNSSSNDKTFTNDNKTSPNDPILQELVLFERQLDDAQIAGDKATFDKLLADDFLHVENGKSYNKEWFLENMKPLKGVTVDIEDPELSLNGETATLTGISVAHLQNGSSVRYKFLNTFVKRDGQWKKTASNISKIVDDKVAKATTASTGSQDMETLSAAFDRGEEVVFKIRYYYSSWTDSPKMQDGLVKVSKTAVVFQPTIGSKGFSVSPDKILEVINEVQQGNRVRLKVAIKNTKGDKEDKKNYEFYHPSTFLDGIMIKCNGCDVSMNVLFVFLQHARGKG